MKEALDLFKADDHGVTFGHVSEPRVTLHRSDWIEMGKPGRITASIEPVATVSGQAPRETVVGAGTVQTRMTVGVLRDILSRYDDSVLITIPSPQPDRVVYATEVFAISNVKEINIRGNEAERRALLGYPR